MRSQIIPLVCLISILATGCKNFGFKAKTSNPNNLDNSLAAATPNGSTLILNVTEDQTLDADLPKANKVSYKLLSNPAYGQLVKFDEKTGSIQYQPNPNTANVSDGFLYRVVSSQGTSSSPISVILKISAVNDAPLAQDLTIEATEDNVTEIELSGTDVDSLDLHSEISQMPAHGTLEYLEESEKWKYTPTENYNGSDEFFFKVSDGDLTSTPKKVTISVAPQDDAPTVQPLNVIVAEDNSVEIDLPGHDIDNQTLTYTFTPNLEDSEVASMPPQVPVDGKITPTQYFTFSESAIAFQMDTERSKLTIAPSANYSGQFQFNYHSSDGQNQSADSALIVTVSPINDSPTIANLTLETDKRSTPLNFQVSDPDDMNLDIVFGPITSSYEDGSEIEATTEHGLSSRARIQFSSQDYKYHFVNLVYESKTRIDRFSVTVRDPQGQSSTSEVTIRARPFTDILPAFFNIQLHGGAQLAANLAPLDENGNVLDDSALQRLGTTRNFVDFEDYMGGTWISVVNQSRQNMLSGIKNRLDGSNISEFYANKISAVARHADVFGYALKTNVDTSSVPLDIASFLKRAGMGSRGLGFLTNSSAPGYVDSDFNYNVYNTMFSETLPIDQLDTNKISALESIWDIHAGPASYESMENNAAIATNVFLNKSEGGILRLGGYDYHHMPRTQVDAYDHEAGLMIGRILATAAIFQRPTFIAITTDGGNRAPYDGVNPYYIGDSSSAGMQMFIIYDPQNNSHRVDRKFINPFNSDGTAKSSEDLVAKSIDNGYQGTPAAAIAAHYLKFANLFEKIEFQNTTKGLLQNIAPESYLKIRNRED